jgi:hypothetical protein
MAGTLKLTDIAHSSGAGTITVDSLATLAISTGKLTVGGTAIETGAHTTAVSAVNPLTITSGNITGKSNYVVSYDAGAGTATTMVVNLPTPANFATTVISVVSAVTHGVGNTIEIRDSAGTEVYTLYHKGDYCTFVSDGTNTLRAGNEWVTVRGEVALTANYSLSSAVTIDLWDAVGASYTEVEDIGSCWSTSNDDFTAPFAGEFMLAGSIVGNGYFQGFGLKNNGTFINAVSSGGNPRGPSMFGLMPWVLAKDDVITFWVSENASTTHHFDGNASASGKRTKTNWWCLRRY